MAICPVMLTLIGWLSCDLWDFSIAKLLSFLS